MIVLDHRYQQLNVIRHYGSIITQPLYYVANLPIEAVRFAQNYVNDRTALLSELERLRQQNLEIGSKLVKALSLEHENSVLRELLQSPSKEIQQELMIAELIGVNPLPLEQKIIINKGGSDGVYTNQAVIDANGIIGQVSSITPYNATVTLISNPGHTLMGQISRTGVRVLVAGTGDSNRLELRYVSASADIRKGDKIITSGLDGRLPAGYPVAIITGVHNESGDIFATLYAKPSSNLGHSYQMLLVNPHHDN